MTRQCAQISRVACPLALSHLDDTRAKEKTISFGAFAKLLESDRGGQQIQVFVRQFQAHPEIASAVGKIAVTDAHRRQQQRESPATEVARRADYRRRSSQIAAGILSDSKRRDNDRQAGQDARPASHGAAAVADVSA